MAVEIDYCPRCRGVWLDGGELEKLMERSQDDDIVPRNGYREPERAPYVYEEKGDGRRGDRGDRYERREPRDDRRFSHPKKRKGFFGELLDLFD